MPIISIDPIEDGFDGRQSEMAMVIRRGVIKGLAESDLVFLPELTLSNSRRADLISLNRKGEITIFEIKSSIADLQADSKWHNYKTYCDQFYFVTHPSVPMEIFPESEGFIFADEYGCEIIREAQIEKLAPATRKAVTLRFARSAALRTKRLTLHEQFIENDID